MSDQENPGPPWTLKECYEYYSDPKRIRTIKMCAKNAYSKMESNNGRFKTDGSFENGKKWWSVENDPLSERHARTQRKALEYAVWEHGILYFMYELQESKVLAVNKDMIRFVTGATIQGVVNIMVNNTIVDGDKANISLSDLGELFCYLPGSRSELVRENKLMPSCRIGFLMGIYDQRYAIYLGPVADSFDEIVYGPLVERFGKNIKYSGAIDA